MRDFEEWVFLSLRRGQPGTNRTPQYYCPNQVPRNWADSFDYRRLVQETLKDPPRDPDSWRSPSRTLNSAASRSAFQRASSGNVKNTIATSGGERYVL